MRGLVPEALKHGPFRLDDARKLGVERWHLQSRWRRLARATYIWTGLSESPMQLLEAARLRLPLEAAFSGLTAAWLHGLDVEPCDPSEVTIPKEAGVSGRAGIAIRQSPLDDVITVRRMRATSLVRTLGELSARLPLIEAVVIADMALHRGLVTPAQLRSWADRHARRRGVRNLGRVIDLSDPAAESPMESRLRMLLLLNGLPRPQAQAEIDDPSGQFAGRVDLYYKDSRLGIEYDGATHRDSLPEDDRRQNRLLEAGVRLLRFTAADIYNRPDLVLAQVRAQLSASPGQRTIRARSCARVPGNAPRAARARSTSPAPVRSRRTGPTRSASTPPRP